MICPLIRPRVIRVSPDSHSHQSKFALFGKRHTEYAAHEPGPSLYEYFMQYKPLAHSGIDYIITIG